VNINQGAACATLTHRADFSELIGLPRLAQGRFVVPPWSRTAGGQKDSVFLHARGPPLDALFPRPSALHWRPQAMALKNTGGVSRMLGEMRIFEETLWTRRLAKASALDYPLRERGWRPTRTGRASSPTFEPIPPRTRHPNGCGTHVSHNTIASLWTANTHRPHRARPAWVKFQRSGRRRVYQIVPTQTVPPPP